MKTSASFILILKFIIETSPFKLVQSVAENAQFQDIDNYLPKTVDLPKYEYPTFSTKNNPEEITFKHHNQETITVAPSSNQNSTINYIGKLVQSYNNNTKLPQSLIKKNYTNIEPNLKVQNSSVKFENQLEAQEEEEEDDEGGNMITGLLSTFLSGLSRPDGSIDVDAITGLLGSLSTQNPDGTYEFSGLQELIGGFFGGDGGGSDIGSFLGGLVGAVLKGVANPPGGKGVGKFTGKIVAGLLPALSGPPPGPDGEPQQGIDPFGFVGGFLKTFFNGSIASVPPSNNSDTNAGKKSKFSIIKGIVSAITSIFTSSSSGSSGGQNQDW